MPTVAEQLKATRGFLFKERTRARQAAVASAVLDEWPRIEATLLDPAARAALRQRLEASREARRPRSRRRGRSRPAIAGAARSAPRWPSSRGCATIRDLAEDLFAFLGLPTSTTREMISGRIQQIGDVNRRRRPDRERTLVDELLAHARKLLLEGDPAGVPRRRRRRRARGRRPRRRAGGARSRRAGQRDRGRRATGPGAGAAATRSGWPRRTRWPRSTPCCLQEREARLRELLERNPGWRLVAGRLATLPPAPPRDVTVAIEHNEALISWSAPSSEPDAYLVERHAPGGSRVLGRTTMLEWTDSAPREGGVTWTVRALRGSAAASEPVTAAAPHAPGVTDLVAVAARPVVLTWTRTRGRAARADADARRRTAHDPARPRRLCRPSRRARRDLRIHGRGRGCGRVGALR